MILIFLYPSFNLTANEGMWLLPLLEKINMEEMNEMGLELTAEQIYSITNSSLKDAIVFSIRDVQGSNFRKRFTDY